MRRVRGNTSKGSFLEVHATVLATSNYVTARGASEALDTG